MGAHVRRRGVGKGADEIVGNGQREHLPQHPGTLRQRLRRGAHAAAGGVAQQRRNAGRADEPDAQRLLETETAQPRHVIEDRARIETELGDDLDRKPGRLGRRDLFRKRLEQRVVADLRMAFRIAGDAERANAAAAEQAGIDGVGGGPERAVFAAVAGNDQNAPHFGLAVQARQEIIERVDAAEIAHRDVGHRLEACRAQPDRGRHGFFRRPVRHGADIDASAARQHGKRRDVGIRRPRRLDGKVLHEARDARHRGAEICGRYGCERGHARGSGAAARDHVGFVEEPKPPRSRKTARVASI